jgi:tetratricopeptide (TPR) repeat protein
MHIFYTGHEIVSIYMREMSMENSAVEIFFSFIDEDRDFYHQIETHLNLQMRQGRIHLCSSDDLLPGDERAKRRAFLERANIIALLISPAYLASDEHYFELERAIEQKHADKAHVLPILLKPGNYEGSPFADLQTLPRNGPPISQWYEKSDEAYEEITTEVRTLLQALSPQPSPDGFTLLWTVPYPRNPLFTGREAELQAIETTLRQGKNAAVGQIQALSGLGGIGKTQMALEYAYRHRQDYRYVFWVLADTRETLNAAYSLMAEQLNLPGKNQPELHYIVTAVKSWLERNEGWLLILDNADDLSILPDFLPLSTASGHVLLTTRSQALGRLAERIEARKLDTKEGISFLLYRSGLLDKRASSVSIDPKEHEAALQIVRELGGLPLALDQAGAYIEETSCGFQGYLALYRKEHKDLLKTRGGQVADHPASVTQTVQMAFKKIEKSNPSAADLLRLCAFLAPEAIPELIIERGEAAFTGPLKQLARKPLKLNAAIADVQKYSLISRNAVAKTLEMHRLVQVVLKDLMTKNVEQAWATRAVRVMDLVFPRPQTESWEVCGQLLPHTQECTMLIDRWHIEMQESQHLLDVVGEYLVSRALYREAQKYYGKALSSSRTIFGKEHPNTASSLGRLATVYQAQGKYAQAVDLLEQALAIQRKVLGERHPSTASSLGNLAVVYESQGKYAQAVDLLEQALAIQRKVLGERHPNTASSLGKLAVVYKSQGKYDQAVDLLEQALAIQRKVLGEEHPSMASSLGNLAVVYWAQGKYGQAVDLYEQVLAIERKVLGEEHPNMARSLCNLALAYQAQGKYEQAVDLHEQALAIQRKMLGEEHPSTARSLNNLAETYLALGKYEQSERLHEQALALLRKALGDGHSLIATSLNNRGELFLAQKRYEEAKHCFQQSLVLQQNIWDETHPDIARSLHNLGRLSQDQGLHEEARIFFQQALAMRRARLGEEHPKTKETLGCYEETMAGMKATE